NDNPPRPAPGHRGRRPETGPFCRRARRCAGISSTAASATSALPPSSAAASQNVSLSNRNGHIMQTVLVTGAAGGIGTRLRQLLKGVYPNLRLSDVKRPADLAADEIFVEADLASMPAVENAVAGVDGSVHLGGFSVEGPWETILQSNIIGCYNLFETARRHRVERVVFASSNHAVGFYPRRRRIGVDAAVRPDSRYGVSKAFGEALGALYAFKHGLRVTCI